MSDFDDVPAAEEPWSEWDAAYGASIGVDLDEPVPSEAPAVAAPVAPVAPISAGSSETPLDDVRAWLGRYVLTIHDADLDVLALWAAHTHLAFECYTTPRLVLDSPVPGSGKTTVLEHLQRFSMSPLQAASLGSPALLTRMLDIAPRTILIDEVDRNLDPKREGVDDLLACINAGYKRGATRPVLVPEKGGGWTVNEMPTFAPIAMAGNAPQLPDDTRSRCIRVLLLPDLEGRIEPSDWEEIEPTANALGERLRLWADSVRDDVRTSRPPLPEKCIARTKERWSPLARVAAAAGGRWPGVVWDLIERDIEDAERDREDGLVRIPPAVALLRDVHEVFEGEEFVPTTVLCTNLVANHPEKWGPSSPYGKALTVQRLGRMLAQSFKVNSTRPGRTEPRGYTRASLAPAWRRLGVETAEEAAA